MLELYQTMMIRWSYLFACHMLIHSSTVLYTEVVSCCRSGCLVLLTFCFVLHYVIRDQPGMRRSRSYLPKLSHFSLFQVQGEVVLHRIYRKNIPKDYHFSSKLQKMVKTSPWFKFVGLPLIYLCY